MYELRVQTGSGVIDGGRGLSWPDSAPRRYAHGLIFAAGVLMQIVSVVLALVFRLLIICMFLMKIALKITIWGILSFLVVFNVFIYYMNRSMRYR